MLTEATIFRGAFWFAIGAFFERTMFFLLPIFIAPLGAAALGIFYISLRIFNSIVSFPTTALNIRYTGKLRKYLEEPKSLKFEETAAFLLKVYFITGLLVGIFSLILIVAVAPLKSLASLALALPFAMVNSYMMHLLQLLQRFKRIFILQAVFVFGFQLLYMIIFIGFFRLGIAAAFAGQLLMVILISIATSFFLFDRLNLLGFFQKISIKTYMLPWLSCANVIFITLSPILDIALVALLFGFPTLGHYVVLLYLPLLMHKIPTTLFGMFTHVAIVKTHASKDITEISKQVFKWMLIISMPVFVVIMLYPEFLLSFIFHKTYVKDLAITRLLAISFFLQSISWMAERILVAKNKKVQRVISNYIFASMFIILSLIFAHFASTFFAPLASIALAYLISSLLDAFIKYVLVTMKTKVLFIGIDHIKILVAAALGSFAAYIPFFNKPLLFFPFFLILYFAILWTVGIVSPKNLSESLREASDEAKYRTVPGEAISN